MCVSGVTCLVAFIITLLFAQNSGIYWVTLFDNFAGSVPLLTIALFEMIAVVYIYGIDRCAKLMYLLFEFEQAVIKLCLSFYVFS